MSDFRLFQSQRTKQTFGEKSGKYFFARITSVNLNQDTPDLVGTVSFRSLSDIPGVEKGIAYPLQPHIKNVPLIDETVLCLIGPSENQEQSGKLDRVYYLTGVNIWNHPQHTGYTRESSEVTLHPNFKESVDINPLLPYPGDVILEGRRGQSIRFSEAHPGTPWTSLKKASPVVIISNGQLQTEQGFSVITEDINADASSIYLTSTHGIPLKESQTFNTFNAPTVSAYETSQVILNGDRLVFNSKLDSILITSSTQVGLKGIDVIVEGTQAVTLEAPRISLGFQADERAVLGDSMVDELTKLYTDLKNVIRELGVLGSVVSYTPMIQVATTALTNIELRENQLKSRLLSNKTYLSK
jgi:hypothetical protein